jgi:hypothetical protein
VITTYTGEFGTQATLAAASDGPIQDRDVAFKNPLLQHVVLRGSRTCPGTYAQDARGSTSEPNAKLIEAEDLDDLASPDELLTVCDIVCLFNSRFLILQLVATQPIAFEVEILISYGDNYWLDDGKETFSDPESDSESEVRFLFPWSFPVISYFIFRRTYNR